MNADRLNTWLTLVANLAVVIGIIFVVFEINQNTQATRISAYQDLIGRVVDLNRLGIENEQLRELTRKLRISQGGETSEHSLEPLTEDETSMYYNLVFMFIRHADMAYFQYENGAIEYDRMLSAISPLTDNLNNPRFVNRWEKVKVNFVPSFQNFVDGLIQEKDEL